MKYAKAILATIAVGVLLDILIDATLPDRVMNVVFVLVASLVLLGILLVSVGTVRRNRWGINFEPVNCPACGSPMPQVRQPKSRRQALWGGWTCAKCGCEVDKWGRLITEQVSRWCTGSDLTGNQCSGQVKYRFRVEREKAKSPLIRRRRRWIW